MPSLLNRIKLGHRFLLLGLMGVLLSMPPLYLYVSDANKSIDFSVTEQAGLKPLGAMLNLLHSMQLHRSLSAAYIEGGHMADSRIAKEAEVSKSLSEVKILLKGGGTAIEALFKQVDDDWRTYVNVRDLTTQQSYQLHSRLCGQILLLIEQLSDTFGLSLDPDADTYNLMRSVFYDLPRLTEDLSQMRAKGTEFLASRQIDTDGRAIMVSLVTKSQVSNSRTRRTFDKVYNANVNLKAKLASQVNFSSDMAEDATELTRNRIAAAETLDYLTTEYIAFATNAINAQFETTLAAQAQLTQLIEARIVRQRNTRNLLTGGVSFLLLFAGLIGWAVCRDLLRQLGGEPEYAGGIVKKVSAGELSVNININAGDKDSLLANMVQMVANLRNIMSEISQARVDAEAANSAKSAFLANMSHEIRTPMNGVLGTLEVLRLASLSPYQTLLVDTIGDSAGILLSLIDDILDFSKIEAGRMELENEPLSLTCIVESVGDAQQPVATSKQVDLVIYTDPSLPDWILSDSIRLRQILNNLLSNAIKFSAGMGARGRVKMRAIMASNSVQLIIADNGIGMSPQAQEKIFTPFTQAENSTTRCFGGSGLGLVICRRLVDLLGGKITIDSTLGKGTTVIVSLPVTVDTTQPPLVDGPDLSGLGCFIVARDAERGQIWVDYLNHAGVDAQIFQDLDSARRQLLSSPRESKILILDELPQSLALAKVRAALAMRSESGVAIISNGIRRHPRLITSDDNSNIVLLDGENPHRTSLLQAVALAAGRMGAEDEEGREGQRPIQLNHGASSNVVAAVAKGHLILVAEDNDINQIVIQRQLAVLGYAAEIANDGSKALALWRTGRHALLLTDLHMPEMDGYELTTTIRKEEQETGVDQYLPIVALTANAVKGEDLRCRKTGMDGYLSKPVPLYRLQEMLEKWLPPEKAARNRINQQAIGVAELVDELAVLDTGVLVKLVGDDVELIEEFIDEYHRSAQNVAAEIRSALTTQDWKAASAGAHKLKSSSRSVGALALGDVCAQLEKAGNDENTDIMSSLAMEFENILAAVIDAINQRKR